MQHPAGGEGLASLTSLGGPSYVASDRPKGPSRIPFGSRSFIDFIGLLGRMFYDDGCVVLLDMLAREQRAFTEADIRERLGWKDSLVHQKLAQLERHAVVAKHHDPEKGVRSPIYWRVSPHVALVVHWKYNQMVARLDKLVRDADQLHEFECSRLDCGKRYTALDAAACSRDLEDEHPLCTKCGEKLKPSECEETKQTALEKRLRSLQQLVPLEQALERVVRMDIPVFPPFTRSDKNGEKRDKEKGDLSGGEPGSGDLYGSSETPAMSPSNPSSASTSAVPTANVIPMAAPAAAPLLDRSIPWFQSPSGAGFSYSGPSNHTPYVSTVPPPSSGALSAAPRINFSLGTVNSGKNGAVPLKTSMPVPWAGTGAAPMVLATAGTSLAPKGQLAGAGFSFPPQQGAVALGQSVPVMVHPAMAGRKRLNDGTVFVQALGKRLRVGEVTPDVTAHMSSAEFQEFRSLASLL